MFKKFQKYQASQRNKPNPSLRLKANIGAELKSATVSDAHIRNYQSVLNSKNRRMTPKQDQIIVDRWKHQRLSEYLPPASKIHSILDTINQQAEQGIDFYFLEGAECFHQDQTSLILFGKVKSRVGDIEAKILIRNPKRLVFVFPKRGEAIEDVEREVRDKLGPDQRVVRFSRVKKKYCFEINLDYR